MLSRHDASMASWFPEQYDRLRLRLIDARRQARLSQVQVAASLDVPQQHVSRVETGDRRIDPAELQAFARLYAVPVSDLLDDE
ncbi:MAG: helix-turn-helix domain-containing protein [Thermoanaerobaculia bacterium]|nr:helix-turn-helix domain-containing protein [Thermoanaerobaculia bacterium]